MANAVYPLYKQNLLSGSANVDLIQTTGNVAPYSLLITTASGYTYSAAHQFFSDLTNIVGAANGVQIASPTVTNGLFNGAACTFTAVSGTVVGAIVIYRQNAGANTTWRLVLYEDTSVTGLPVTPNGGNIIITWNASGIFQLSDQRAKTDLKRLGKVGPLTLHSYRYRGSKKRQVGFLAQEVAEVVPRATRKQGRYWTVDYHRTLSELAA